MKILPLLWLLFFNQAYAQNFKFGQKRFELTYQRQGHQQTLKFKGSILMSSGEKAEILLKLLRERVEANLETKIVLDVFGGDLAVVNKIFAELKGKCHDRGYQSCKITTEVEMFRTCASACIPLFMVGDIRRAAERSEWGFHQAALPGGLVMIPLMSEYVLRQKGVSAGWLEKNKKMFRTLKVTWLSPLELGGSNIVTQLTPHPR
jgi:hypothetical protein